MVGFATLLRRLLRDRLRTEQVERLRRPLRRLSLHLLEQAVERGLRDRVAVRVDRGPARSFSKSNSISWAVLPISLRRLSPDRGRRRAGSRSGPALLADLRLRHAELVDAALHDRDRPVEIGRRQRVALRRHRLQHDLEAALEVEAEDRLLVDRRARARRAGPCRRARPRSRPIRRRYLRRSVTCPGRVAASGAGSRGPGGSALLGRLEPAVRVGLRDRGDRAPRDAHLELRARCARSRRPRPARDLAVHAACGDDLVADLRSLSIRCVSSWRRFCGADQHEVQKARTR